MGHSRILEVLVLDRPLKILLRPLKSSYKILLGSLQSFSEPLNPTDL